MARKAKRVAHPCLRGWSLLWKIQFIVWLWLDFCNCQSILKTRSKFIYSNSRGFECAKLGCVLHCFVYSDILRKYFICASWHITSYSANFLASIAKRKNFKRQTIHILRKTIQIVQNRGVISWEQCWALVH